VKLLSVFIFVFFSANVVASGNDRLHLLSYSQLKDLQPDHLEKYLSELRLFLRDQEEKKLSHPFVQRQSSKEFFSSLFLSESSWAQEIPPPGACFSDDELSDPQKNYIIDAGDRCVIGGYVVCLTLKNKALRCSPDRKEYQEKIKTDCPNSDGPTLTCAYPLFMDKDFKTLCIKRGPGSVTQQCLKSDKGIKPEEIATQFKNSDVKDKYELFKKA
jgi:hypothetical protein